MKNPVHSPVEPLTELLSGFDEAEIKEMAAIIEAAESGPEPDNSGITSRQFLEAVKLVSDRYKGA
jgi:hypothetical protein